MIQPYSIIKKCNYNSNYKCFEEIYKILYIHWTKLHNNKYIDEPELQFGLDSVLVVDILRRLFMKDSAISGVSGKLPTITYKKFLYHTIVHKLMKKTSKSFNKFLEILFMSILEENAITGIIKLNNRCKFDKKIIQHKKNLLNLSSGTKDLYTISNSDIINIIIKHRQSNKK